MTKKQKPRRNSFAADFNASDDNFILADLDVRLNEEELSPVPLNHFLDDEETIDRLLINSGFDDSIELKENNRDSATLAVDDISLTDDMPGFDQFIIEPIALTEESLPTKIEEMSISDIHSMTDFDEIAAEEDAIDRLLVNVGFDANDESKEDDRLPKNRVINEISLVNECADSDKFVVESIEQAKQNQQAETEEISTSELYLMADFGEMPTEEDGIDRLLVETGFDVNNKLKEDERAPNESGIDDISQADGFGIDFEEQNAMAADAGIFDTEENESVLNKDATNVFLVKEEDSETVKQEQAINETTYQQEISESLNKDAGITMLSSVIYEQDNIKKQINDNENKVKKAAIVTYTSLGFGIVALILAVVMGAIVSSVQTKVSKLTELVSILEEDMSSMTEKNSDMDINNNDSSIDQLNQKVNALPEQFEERTRSSSEFSENKVTTGVTKQAIANKSFDNLQAKPPVRKDPNQLTKQTQPSVEVSKKKITTAVTKLTNANKSFDNLQTRTPISEKKKPSEAAAKKILAEKKKNNTRTTAGWSAVLTAYEDLSYAKSKAEKFKQKGIPVKVIAVDMNNTIWYRLKVGGFKNKEEATSYAAKIKKSLNLGTVSVSNF